MPEVFSLASSKERQSNEKKTSGTQGNFLGLRIETK